MKLKKAIAALLCLSVCAIFCCTGCGAGGESSEGDGGGSKSVGTPKFDFSNIEWSVDSGVIDGDRVVMFNYDNNSDYDIAEVSLKFKMKDDTTDEEIKAFSELSEKAKEQEEKLSELTIEAWAEKIIGPGDSVQDVPMQLDGTYQYFTTYDAYDLFEPDMMTVIYIENNKLYTAYYDYRNQETSYDDEVLDAYTWSDSELAALIPKPDVKIVAPGFDSETTFSANAYGVSKEMFEQYKKQCEEKGFKGSSDNYVDWDWRAKDKNGNELELIYVEEDEKVGIHVDAPDKE